MKNRVVADEEQSAYEKSPIPFCSILISKESCTLLTVSDGMCRAFGVDRSVFSLPYPKLIRDHIHPEDQKRLRPDLESACLNPNGQYSAVYRIQLKEHEPYRWISGRGCVVRQEDGSYLLYSYWSDVQNETELHQEEVSEKIRQDVLLSEILSTTKTSIFWKDADRRFLGANKAFLDYYGFADVGEILGKNDEEMGWHTEPDPYKNDELCILRDGISTYRVPGKCIAKGVNRYIVASKSHWLSRGRSLALLAVLKM